MKNRLKSLSPQFKKILKISSQIAHDSGHKIYLVGGVVRDLLLGRQVFDLDIAVEGDAIFFVERLAKHLGENFKRHHSFGTATLYHHGHKIDFATSREEKYSQAGALPKVKAAELKKDLWRRDFTINAMAISLNRQDYGGLIDFYGGRADLEKGLIRVLHPESFLDDSLRVLRAVRFEQRFSFKIENKTDSLMSQAIGAGALGWVNPHRLRDELILLLSEPSPYRYIKRFYSLERFNFIDKSLSLNKKDFRFFIRVQSMVNFYNQKLKRREIKVWVIYLAGILINLPSKDISQITAKFGFKKGERIIISSIKEGLKEVGKLNKKMKPSQIHKIMDKYSYEAVLFFYAYFPQALLRKNLRLFLNELSFLKLETAGRDLKKLGVESSSLMGQILRELLYLKLDQGLRTKREELRAVKKILKIK